MTRILLIEIGLTLTVMMATIQADAILDVPPEDVVENPTFLSWENDYWSPGQPDSSCSVEIPTLTDDFGDPVSLYLDLENPVTLENLHMEFDVDLDTAGNNLFVNDTTSGHGFLSVRSPSTASLGTLDSYDPATKTLNSGTAFAISGQNPPQLAIVEFRGADIEVNKGGFNLFGPNVRVRDQNTGLPAFRNLRRNEGFLVMDYGFTMSINGNFVNEGSITMALNPSAQVSVVNIAGNFVNNGTVSMRGNTALNVAGGYSGTGTIGVSGSNNQVAAAGAFELGAVQTEVIQDAVVTIDADVINRGDLVASGYGGECIITGNFTQNGGSVDTGPQPPSGEDSFILRAQAQFYDGGVSVQGNGRLEAPRGIVAENGRIFPGRSPGRLSIIGNLTLGIASELGVEIGGNLPGSTYDVLAQSGGDTGVDLAGRLTVSLIDDFTDTFAPTDTWSVVTSDLPIGGAFSNVASGSRIWTLGGEGSFRVEYGPGSSSPNAVQLSDFTLHTLTTTSYAAWATSMNLPAGKDGPLDDADGNGEANLLAYFGGSSSGVPFTIESRGTQQVAIAEFANSVDDEYQAVLETSPDPSPDGWSPAEGARVIGRTQTTVVWEVPLPTGLDRLFLRVRIIEAP